MNFLTATQLLTGPFPAADAQGAAKAGEEKRTSGDIPAGHPCGLQGEFLRVAGWLSWGVAVPKFLRHQDHNPHHPRANQHPCPVTFRGRCIDAFLAPGGRR